MLDFVVVRNNVEFWVVYPMILSEENSICVLEYPFEQSRTFMVLLKGEWMINKHRFTWLEGLKSCKSPWKGESENFTNY